jgi:hypothetical protein
MASYYDQVNGLAPRVWYRFNETAGTPVNSGGLTTTSTFNNLLLNEQTDVDGRAVYFNGSSSYVNINQWPAFSLFDDKSFTIETWFKLSTQDANNRPIFQFGSFAIDQITLRSVGTADANSGKLHLNITSIGEQVSDRDMYSTNTYFDNTWHHTVIAVNTTSLKWYIDGQLIHTKTLATGTLNIDSLSTSPNTYRLIGASRSNVSGNIGTTTHKGWLDEFAIYGYELSAQQVLDNFNAGASVNFADIPGTATALAVMPAFSVETVIAAAPMTASADGSGHAASTVEFPTLLNTYMSGLGLQVWFKFDVLNQLENYGSGEDSLYLVTGDPVNNVTGGIQGSGSWSLNAGDRLINSSFTGTLPNLYTYENQFLNDEDFAIGFWTKKLTAEEALIITAGTGGSDAKVQFKWNTNGGITFLINANNTDYSVASTSDITDGEWHFVVGKLASNTMELFIDNTSIGTNTMNHGLDLRTIFVFGDQPANATYSDRFSISQFFIATATAIGSTQIANMWDYGTPTFTQAAAYMPPAAAKFNSAFNDYIGTKSPLIDFRMDEGSGVPRDYGSLGLVVGAVSDPVGYTQNNASLNTRAFNFTKPNQGLAGSYTLPTGTVSDSDVLTYGVLFKLDNKTTTHDLGGFGGGSSTSNGIQLRILTSTGYIEAGSGNGNSSFTRYSGNVDYADNKWHLAILVQDTNTLKLYVDGKEHISQSRSTAFTDAGTFGIGRLPGTTNTNTTSINKYIDETFVLTSAMTAQEAFEAWQKLRLEMDTTASASFPMVTNIAGTGYTDTPAPMTAFSDFVMPAFSTDQILDAAPGTASALFVLPNFGGNVVIDANYGHTVATASAVFHEPQFQIGDFHSADHMDASALMLQPLINGGGTIAVPSAVALDATFVMPGIVTIKGARIFAEPMRAQSLFPLPPAYIQLTDDPWFVRLYEAHADRKTEPVQAYVTSGQQSTDIIKGGFLTFFDDILTDRSPTSNPNTISSEIPAYFFLPVSSTGATNTTKASSTAIAPRQSSNPAPLLAIAGQDNQERKAVRVNNIEFVFPDTSKNHSERYYNLEFSIKTTKADQVLSYGQWESFIGYGSRIGVIGLSDGKIYLATDDSNPLGTTLADLRRNIPSTAPHPKNKSTTNDFNYFQGRNNIADGNWHHVIIQYGWTDGRTQIWVDGYLDRQIGVLNELGGSGYASFDGSNGTNEIRPYILGFNSNDPLLYSDFTISAWNFYPGRFLEQRDITLNYNAYAKWEPIKAEPMTATVRMTNNNTGKGNRPRALLLYWWNREDDGRYGYWDEPTFPLGTEDAKDQPPQQYYGWDIFPIDILGRSQSDMIKEGVWMGYGYRDSITGSPRYLDLMNDIDISQFDAIFFKNYPEQTEELDEYVREEFSDTYFGVKEEDLYSDFLKSLRAAVDSGLSLFITNAKLALDLGIIDRVERVSDLSEGDFEATDTFVQNRFANLTEALTYDSGAYTDTWRNNRLRVVNTFEDITNYPTYLWRDWMFFTNNDAINYGGVNRPYISLLDRPNGLQVNDEFIISDAYTYGLEYEAVPFVNVKAGTIITAFANTVDRNGVAIDNPFRNYATCIAVPPGTILNGKATGGKIFVNFTERIAGTVSQITGAARNVRPHWKSRDTHLVELIQDKWINQAYNDGSITLARKNELLASPDNLDRQLEDAITAGNQSLINSINGKKYWDFNGVNIISNKQIINDPTGGGVERDGLGDGVRKSIVNKTSRKGAVSTRTVSSELQWFTITWGYKNPTIQIKVPSILSNGFSWLADKIAVDGTVVRVAPMTANALQIPQPLAVGDKDRTVYAQAALANARIVHAPGYQLESVTNTSLPLLAEAKFGDFVKNIKPDVFTATAAFRQNVRTVGIEEDEIVVYINHVDPILYLREEVIK